MTMMPTPIDNAKPLLRDYEGNGAQIAISEQCDKGYIGTIMLTAGCFAVFWIFAIGFCLTTLRFVIGDMQVNSRNSILDDTFIASMSLGVIIYTLAVVISLHPYMQARRKFLATKKEAEYWLANEELRVECRKPRSADEFKTLIYAAEALDAQKYAAHVRTEMRKSFVQLRRERGFEVSPDMLANLDELSTRP